MGGITLKIRLLKFLLSLWHRNFNAFYSKMTVSSQNSVFYDSPVGIIEIGHSEDHITKLHYVASDEPYSLGGTHPLTDRAYGQLMEYFQGHRKSFDLPFRLSGTPFQLSVWRALCEIPYGECCSYKKIAQMIGNPKACRAVGMANNRNPISIVVPCHRVVGANGSLVGYGGGLEIKKKLLEIEGLVF